MTARSSVLKVQQDEEVMVLPELRVTWTNPGQCLGVAVYLLTHVEVYKGPENPGRTGRCWGYLKPYIHWLSIKNISFFLQLDCNSMAFCPQTPNHAVLYSPLLPLGSPPYDAVWHRPCLWPLTHHVHTHRHTNRGTCKPLSRPVSLLAHLISWVIVYPNKESLCSLSQMLITAWTPNEMFRDGGTKGAFLK